ncbi:hypothetical protein FQA39_LY19054 [Lamprigera yunnana]|nr:hypothetical protein FQA39_LY19054 [Lamprigera yunnana]
MCSQLLDKDYLIRCSEKTLQTGQKGFFLQFADHVSDVAGSKWIKNVFGKLKSDGERIRIIYQYSPEKNHVIDDGFTLSLAYWTRAIVLMELKKYTWALRDLQAALKKGFQII